MLSVKSFKAATKALSIIILVGLLIAIGQASATEPLAPGSIASAATENTLLPYQATYQAKIKGFNSRLKRVLKQQKNGLWQLDNNATVFFANITESSLFSIDKSQLRPVSYHYKNPLSSSRNSSLIFNHQLNNVRETAQSAKALPLATNSYDKLSFQMQIRLDLLNRKDQFKQAQYTVVDGDRLKTYHVEWLAEEKIIIEAGVFNAVKLKQFRPGKNKYTLIWLAKDHQYLILQLQRIKDGKVDKSIELQQASINGQPL